MNKITGLEYLKERLAHHKERIAYLEEKGRSENTISYHRIRVDKLTKTIKLRNVLEGNNNG